MFLSMFWSERWETAVPRDWKQVLRVNYLDVQIVFARRPMGLHAQNNQNFKNLVPAPFFPLVGSQGCKQIASLLKDSTLIFWSFQLTCTDLIF